MVCSSVSNSTQNYDAYYLEEYELFDEAWPEAEGGETNDAFIPAEFSEAPSSLPSGEASALEDFPEDPQDIGSLKREIDAFLDTVAGLTTLSGAQATELKTRCERFRLNLELNPESFEVVASQFYELQAEWSEKFTHSSLANQLATYSGEDVSQIEAMARNLGVDLEKPISNPPEEKFLKLLAELDPKVQEAIEAVRQAVDEKIKSEESTLNTIQESTAANLAGRRDNDSYPWTALEEVWKANQEPPQDKGSLDIQQAVERLQNRLEDALGAASPGQSFTLNPDQLVTTFEIQIPQPPSIPVLEMDNKGRGRFDLEEMIEIYPWLSDFRIHVYNGRSI